MSSLGIEATPLRVVLLDHSTTEELGDVMMTVAPREGDWVEILPSDEEQHISTDPKMLGTVTNIRHVVTEWPPEHFVIAKITQHPLRIKDEV
jgi:hypothetical protein